MEVIIKQGYKQTEVGLIPKDWNLYSLRELGDLKNGINKSKEDFGHGSPFVNLMDVFNNPSLSSKLSFDLINSNNEEQNLYSLNKGDVLFVRSSVKPSGVGLTALISENLKETVFSGFLIRLRFKIKLYDAFKIYCFSQSDFRNRLIASSSVSANTNINQDSLHELHIPLPPTLTEQKAIATALTDIDNLINNLEQQIQKKKAIKKGAMQQLLTGKTRIKGFEGSGKFKQTEVGLIPNEWEVNKIGDLTSASAGGTPSTLVPSYWNGDIPWMNSGELNNKKIYEVHNRITKQGLVNSSTKYIPRYSVLIGLAGQGKTRGTAAINFIKLCTNQSIAAIYPSDKFDSFYLYYFLDSQYDELRKMSTGDGGRGGLNLSIIKSIILPMPQTLKEQKAIAEILSDMDKEIEQLQAKKAKYQAIKQGMMQELLTGKTRLV